ncbi:hypothetical protein [Bacillus thuringiensis]
MGILFAPSIKETTNCSIEIIKCYEFYKFVVLPKRWIGNLSWIFEKLRMND